MMCEGCTADEHWRCGMQTWCECECDGSIDWGMNEPGPDEGLEIKDEEHGRWYGDAFCPHPGKPCIDGCYFCGRPVAIGAHDHTMVEKRDDPLKERYSCVCPNC